MGNAISVKSRNVLSLIGSKLLFRNGRTAENASILTSIMLKETATYITKERKLNVIECGVLVCLCFLQMKLKLNHVCMISYRTQNRWQSHYYCKNMYCSLLHLRW